MSDESDIPAVMPAEQARQCEAWQMPELEPVGELVQLGGKPKRRSIPESHRKPVDPFAGPMTASKAQAIQEQAYQEGLELGRQAGMQQAEAEINQMKAQINHLMGQMIHPLQQQQQELELALVHLSAGMARALIKNLPQVDEQAMLGIARQALAELPEGSENIRIMVHPNDVDLLTSAAQAQGENWQIIADPSLVSGGCMIRSQHSFVDFTLDTRFQLMLEDMLGQKLGAGHTEGPA
ncbi:hypothetical protein imdm_175 [gamma proteobacterium IMCC2047]|nr:hypothetical protein imdm_175 [gamma proteobacterium IMCC2047]